MQANPCGTVAFSLCLRLLDSRSCFTSMTNLADLTPSTVLHAWLPRNCCVSCLHCARGFIFFGAAYPHVQPDGSSGAWRFFVQRRALPECLLTRNKRAIQTEESRSNKEALRSSLYTYPDQVYEVVEELFEALGAQILHWSLSTMLAQGQLASVSESRSHLLLLPDIRLSHFPFESLPVLKRLFGYRISRDFSLHMFARRMQHHDSISPANQPKRTLAEMHCGFSRESLLLLPEATDCQNLQNMAKSGKQTTEEESQVAGLPVNDGTATAKSADCPPAFSTFLPPQREPKSDWRPPVVADLLSAKRTSSMDGTPESPPCSSFIPELLCTKAPQAAWALSLNKIVRDSDDINCAIVGMNLMHISLLGLLLMREKPSHCEAYLRQGQQLRPTTSYSQTLEISKGVQTLLMLSTRGETTAFFLLCLEPN